MPSKDLTNTKKQEKARAVLRRRNKTLIRARCEFEADSLAEDLNLLFQRKVEIPRIRHGNKQTIDTLINEEAYLLAMFLRHERKTWIPRTINLI